MGALSCWLFRMFMVVVLVGLAAPAWAENPIFSAVLANDPAQVSAAIKADPQSVKAVDDITKGTALISACRLHEWAKNRNKIIALLLEKGSDPNARDFMGDSPLHAAAASGNIKAVKMLLAKGADASAANKKERTPLQDASRYGRTQIADLLMQQGAVVQTKSASGCGPLYEAAENGNPEMVSKLLGAGAEIDQPCGSYDRTPLHVACSKGHIEVVKLLVAQGADMNRQDDEGFNSLHHAAFWDQRKVAAFLLVRGVDINTPLDLALDQGNDKVVKLLQSKGGKRGQ